MMTSGFRQNARIVLALVGKDLTDLLKNRGLLTTIGTVAFLMVLYQVMPLLGNAGDPQQIALYDPGHSGLADQLEGRDGYEVYIAESMEEMEHYVGSDSSPALGLVIPADFDQDTSSEEPIQFRAILDHWVSDSQAVEIQAIFEAELSDVTGSTVQLKLDHDAVLTHHDGWRPFVSSLSLLVLVTVLGLLVTPGMMLEEKQGKTMDALLASPAGPTQIVLGKALSTMLLCLAGAGIWLALNAHLVVIWDILLIAVVTGTLFAVSLGLLLGTLLEVQQQAPLWSFVLFQPLLLGPVFAYLDLLPEKIRAALLWIPTSGLARTLRFCFTAETPLSVIGRDLAVLVGATGLTLMVVVTVLRRANR
jgi:ABC-type Na+ efflux pump permease subunit